MSPPDDNNLDRLFNQRDEIDRELMEKHSRELAVLFTDIVGSTQYFERHGDIAGMQLLHRHNAILFPLVEQHRGRIIKTIGDAIMASFDSPPDALRCGAAMQRALAEENARQPNQPIHVRIGAHSGRAMLRGNDVFGDTVNTASRVAHEAKGDEVLSSQSLFDTLPSTEGWRSIPKGGIALKGKAEPLPVVAVVWREGAEAEEPAPAAAAPDEPALVLQLSQGPRGLKVALDDTRDPNRTVRNYREVAVTEAALESVVQEFSAFLDGTPSPSYGKRIQEQGEALFQKLLPADVQARLRESSGAFLRLEVDDGLARIPWELMHDGADFLSLGMRLGRSVASSAARPSEAPRTSSGGHLLVIADPRGDLPAAVKEGDAVAGLLAEAFPGQVRTLKGRTTRAQLAEALKGARWVHFAGHTEAAGREESGSWLLADGRMGARELVAALGEAPALVFANSCHSSAGAGFRGAETSADFAAALLLAGTRHFVGASWPVDDGDALTFALRFYEQCLAGTPYGEAVRVARQTLAQKGTQPFSFAGYVLYGDPRERPALPKAAARPAARPRGSNPPPAFEAPTRSDRPVGARTEPVAAVDKPKSRAPLVAVGVLAILGAGAFALLHRTQATSGSTQATTAVTPPVSGGTQVPSATPHPPVPHTGPVRVCILPFKDLGGDAAHTNAAAALDLANSLPENISGELAASQDIRLVERGQIDLDVKEMEFAQKYVDASTRAQLGKLTGAEVAVLGGFQRAGKLVRVNARFVNVESGEVVVGVKAERNVVSGEDIFPLQDSLAAQVREATSTLVKRMRP